MEESWAIRCVCLARRQSLLRAMITLDLTPRLARGEVVVVLVMRSARRFAAGCLHLQYAQCSFSAHQGCESSYDVSVASNGVHALQMEQARHLQWEPVGAARHVQGTLAARHAQARQLDGLVMV